MQRAILQPDANTRHTMRPSGKRCNHAWIAECNSHASARHATPWQQGRLPTASTHPWGGVPEVLVVRHAEAHAHNLRRRRAHDRLRAQQPSSCRAVAQHPACTKAGEITAHPNPRAVRCAGYPPVMPCARGDAAVAQWPRVDQCRCLTGGRTGEHTWHSGYSHGVLWVLTRGHCLTGGRTDRRSRRRAPTRRR